MVKQWGNTYIGSTSGDNGTVEGMESPPALVAGASLAGNWHVYLLGKSLSMGGIYAATGIHTCTTDVVI